MISKAELEAMGCVFWMPNPELGKPDLINNVTFNTKYDSGSITTKRVSNGDKCTHINGCHIESNNIVIPPLDKHNRTWCAWINCQNIVNTQHIFSRAKIYTAANYQFGIKSSKIVFGYDTSNMVYAIYGNTILNLNIWYFIVCKTDGWEQNENSSYNSNGKIYLNSKLDGSGNVLIDNTVNYYAINGEPTTNRGEGNLIIKDLMIFNEELTEEQIKYIYEKTFIR